jgi:hypothetical protein
MTTLTIKNGDEQFYHRSTDSWMPEDRPRGGGPTRPVKHRGTLATVGMVAGIILLVLVGIALFP